MLRIKYTALLLSFFLYACDKNSDSDGKLEEKKTVEVEENLIHVENPGFEMKDSSWSVSQHAGKPAYEFTLDKASYEGDYSIKVENIRKQAYGLVSQNIKLPEGLEGKALHISSYVKTENIGPNGFASIITFESKYGNIMTQKYSEKLKGTHDWQESIIDVEIPKDAGSFKFGFILLDSGIGWGDNVQITYQ